MRNNCQFGATSHPSISAAVAKSAVVKKICENAKLTADA
jgi:hypothetical protein